jgi:NifU-like protein involved in Fe-S cluster formation
VLPDPYSEAVRRRFANPAHAGDLPPGYAPAAVAEASGGSGLRIRLAAAAEGGVVRALRFRAFGCPHLIAAAEAACEEYEGRPAAELRRFSVPALIERLAVPVEKTGRILLLEDALAALAERLTGTNPGEN